MTRRVIQGAAQRFGTLHKGITLKVVDLRDEQADIEMRFPLGLVPEVKSRSYATALRAAGKVSGGRDVTARVTAHDQLHSSFVVSWK